jgi:hypothetical protein
LCLQCWSWLAAAVVVVAVVVVAVVVVAVAVDLWVILNKHESQPNSELLLARPEMRHRHRRHHRRRWGRMHVIRGISGHPTFPPISR